MFPALDCLLLSVAVRCVLFNGLGMLQMPETYFMTRKLFLKLKYCKNVIYW